MTGIQIRGLARNHDDGSESRDPRSTERHDRRDIDGRQGAYVDRDHPRRDYRSYETAQHRRSPSSERRGPHDLHDHRHRNRQDYQSPERNARSGPSSPGRGTHPPYYGGEPSRDVILEGLPADVLENDVRHHSPAQKPSHPHPASHGGFLSFD